ncbi:hypothetical protein JXL19_11240 [bacterium]|nr:hypothetical protein [bacterium]
MNYVILFSFSFLFTTILVPLFIKVGKRYGIVDHPTSRKVHSTPIVRTGGAAMLVGSMFPFVLSVPKNRLLLGICLGMLCIFSVGMIDDIREIGYQWKFLGQSLAALMTLFISNIGSDIIIRLWSGFSLDHGFFSIPLYFVFLVASINIINLADGLDGLASGICLLIFCCTAFFSYFSGNLPSTLLCMCMLGGIIGFMRYNTYPAIVFLGDTGSMFLGYTVGLCMILLTSGHTRISPIIPLYIIGVPVIDTSMVIFERWMDKRPVFKADKNHFHHKLLKIGFKHNEAVIIIYSIQLVMIILAWTLRSLVDGILIVIYLLMVTSVLFFLFLFKNRDISLPQIHREHYQDNGHVFSRKTICNVAFYTLLAGIIIFCSLALIAVRSSIPVDIGWISLGLIICILILRKFQSRYVRGVLKLSAYFIAFFLIFALDARIKSIFSVYNILIIGMAISYVIYIISSLEKMPFFSMDFLMLGVIVFVFLLSESQPWLTAIRNVIIYTLSIFLFIELIFYKYREKKLLWPIFITLSTTCTFAFWI